MEIEVSDQKILRIQSAELKRLNAVIESLRGCLQNEERCRYRAERVLAVIASSTTGDYDWCKRVSAAILAAPGHITVDEILSNARGA